MKDLEAYKTIKVPVWVYENAKEVELALLRKGFERLPTEVLQPRECPICTSKLRTIKAQKNEYLHCDHCGYTQQLFELGAKPGEGVMLGTAIGMGLVYLLNRLFQRTGNGSEETTTTKAGAG